MSLLFKRINQVFFAPDTPTGGGPTIGGTPPESGPKGMGKEDVIEFLSDEPEEKDVIELDTKKKSPPPSEGKEKDEKERKTDNEEDIENASDDEIEDELKELEEELEGPTDEQLELITPARRRDILKKYPELFKEFPYLERAYYREQQFTEVFPTIDDAKAASDKATALDRFETELMSGKTENILKAVKEENPDSFYKIADNYLASLAEVDEKAYYHVLSNLTKNTIISMVKEARRSNNQALQTAAQLLNQFVFGSSEFTPPSNLSKGEDSPQKREAETQNQEFMRERFNTVASDLDTRVNNTLRNTIAAHIDPNGTMSEYVKRNAIQDALSQLGELIGKDSRLRVLNDKLWEKAAQSNFSAADIEKIKTAHLSKAKTLLPAVIRKVRLEATKGARRTNSGEEKEPRTNPISAGRPRSETSGKIKSAREIPKKMTTLEFLNSD